MTFGLLYSYRNLSKLHSVSSVTRSFKYQLCVKLDDTTRGQEVIYTVALCEFGMYNTNNPRGTTFTVKLFKPQSFKMYVSTSSRTLYGVSVTRVKYFGNRLRTSQ